MSRARARVVVAAPLLALALVACDRGQPCPPCDCQCAGDEADNRAADSGVADDGRASGPERGASEGPTTRAGELGELVQAANRKLAHGDGPGCLAELDKVKAIDVKLDAQMIMVRAQCQMAAGDCQIGKQAVTDYYVREMAFTRERAAKMAESLASMRCKGGDASERDKLLAAYFDLSDGAYINKRDVDFCAQRVATIVELAAKVQPQDVEDTQITGGRQALFMTGAMCFARAGDCAQAYAHYRRFFPADNLDALDPSLREASIRETFDASVELCAKPAP